MPRLARFPLCSIIRIVYEKGFALVLIVSVLTALGCATNPVVPAAPKSAASEHAQASADKDGKHRKRGPALVAPPPAYGNRVVWFEADDRRSGPDAG